MYRHKQLFLNRACRLKRFFFGRETPDLGHICVCVCVYLFASAFNIVCQTYEQIYISIDTISWQIFAKPPNMNAPDRRIVHSTQRKITVAASRLRAACIAGQHWDADWEGECFGKNYSVFFCKLRGTYVMLEF